MLKYRLYNIFKELSKISYGYLFTAIGAFIGIRILTTYLSPSQYGELSLGMTMGGMIYSIIFGPISSGIGRFLPIAKERNEEGIYLDNVYGIISKLSIKIAFLSIFIIIIFYFSEYQKWLDLLLASIGFGFIYSFNNLIICLQEALRKRGIVSFNQGLMTIARFLFAVIFIKIFGSSGSIVIYGQFIGLLLVLISQIYFFRKTIRTSINNKIKTSEIDWQSQIINYSRPLITLGFLNWLRLAAEKWGLFFFTNYDEAVGYYSIIYQFGYYPIALIINFLLTYLRPIYFEKAGDDKRKLKTTYYFGIKIFIFSFISLALFILVISNFRNVIFGFILDKNYISAIYLIPPMMLAALLSESTSFVSVLIKTKKETKSLILPNTITYISGLLLAIIGAYFGGLYGIVFGSVLNSFIKFILFAYLCNYQYKKLNI